MRKSILYIFIIGVGVLLAYYGFKYRTLIKYVLSTYSAKGVQVDNSAPVLAVFYLDFQTPNKVISDFSHYRVKLANKGNWKNKAKEIAHLPDSMPLMITVETWGENLFSSYKSNPLGDLVNGKFDKEIQEFCTQFIGTRSNVFLRFNPEMEVPVKRYPWQRFGKVYIDAYRHFSVLCKTYAPQVQQVWGPAGYPGVMEFYPGDDLVDAASIVVKSDSEMSLEVYPKNYPVDYDILRRIHRLRFLKKPIFVMGSNFTPRGAVDSAVVESVSKRLVKGSTVAYSMGNYERPFLHSKSNYNLKLEIGLYDPKSLLNMEPSVTVEHLFVDFGNLQDGGFENNFKQVIARNHDIIVTFEPFRNPIGQTDFQVLQNVNSGKYDKEIAQFYEIITNTDRIVYLRYAHEMEIPITRYPWQSQDPVDYINSFRYFMNFKESQSPTIKRVWGPAGDRGSLEWYPGNDVVDFVSIAIYGLPDKNITDPEKQESFATIFNRKYWRFRFINKPIFITEFGVKGPEDYQFKWLEGAAETILKNPQIIGVNYFNMSDTPKAWGEIKPPDWSISKKSFRRFTEILKTE